MGLFAFVGRPIHSRRLIDSTDIYPDGVKKDPLASLVSLSVFR